MEERKLVDEELLLLLGEDQYQFYGKIKFINHF